MPIYKQTTEITNIDDLLSSVERDIEEIYFGDKNVFTVWAEYDGILPAQYNANGDYLADYRIYGASGGVGDDSGTAYGYEVDMATKSRNVMPSAAAEAKTENGVTISCDGEGRYYISGTATVQTFIDFDISPFTIPTSVSAGGNGTFSMFNNFGDPRIVLYFCNRDINIDSWSCNPAYRTHTTYNVMGSKECNKIKFKVEEGMSVNGIVAPMLTEDGTLPTIYQPYSNTITPIYIGDTPLGEDEYVSFEERKVYRRTENLFDIKTAVMGEYWIDDRYNTFTYHIGAKCYFIPVPANTSYTVTDFTEILPSDTFVFRAAFTNEIPTAHASYVGTTYLKQRINSAGGSKHTATLTNVNYAYLAVQITAAVEINNNVVISEGTTAPEQYIPYLQPTDPPVPLPALPTVAGVNIVDYAGQSAAVPSRFYAKYRKQNF